jgi:hypothetical protein
MMTEGSAMTYTLVVINNQGASQESEHTTKAEVRDAIRSWSDPENLQARVWDDGGTQVYDGSALGF